VKNIAHSIIGDFGVKDEREFSQFIPDAEEAFGVDGDLIHNYGCEILKNN
jgi:hypothetical protein